jgi:hypothetical protein
MYLVTFTLPPRLPFLSVHQTDQPASAIDGFDVYARPVSRPSVRPMGRLATYLGTPVDKNSIADCVLHAAYMAVCTAIAAGICAPLLGVAPDPLMYAFCALCYFFDTVGYAAASTAPVSWN